MFGFISKICLYGAVFLAPFLFAPWELAGFAFARTALFFFLILAGALAKVFEMVLEKRELRFRRTPLDLPVVFFIVVAFVSVFFSEDRWSSFNRLLWVFGGAGLFFLVLNRSDRSDKSYRTDILLKTFLAAAALVAVLTYLQLFGLFEKVSLLKGIAFAHGETFAVFLGVAAVLLMGLARQAGLIGFMGPIGLIGLIGLMGSKTALWVAVAGNLAVLAGLLLQRIQTGETLSLRKVWFPLATTIGVVLFLGVQFPLGFVRISHEPVLDSAISWNAAWETIGQGAKQALIGSGPGTFDADVLRFRPSVEFEGAGNAASEILATQGVLGLGARFVLFAITFLMLAILVASGSWAALPLFGGIVALGFAQFAAPLSPLLEFSLWFFMGLGAASALKARETVVSLKKYLEIALLGRVVLGGFAVAFGAALWYGWRFSLAEAKFYRIAAAAAAAELNPWQAEYQIALSELYLGRVLQELEKPEHSRQATLAALDAGQAIAFANRAVELAPNRAKAWIARGRTYRELGSVPGAGNFAQTSFTKALELDRANPLLYVELGKLEFSQKNFAKAKEHFERALLQQSRFPQALFQLALVQEAQGNAEKAAALLQELIFENPRESEYLFQLGRIYYNGNQLERAISQFQKVLEIAPNHSNARYSLGTAYEKEGNIQEALKEFQRVLELNPSNEAVREKVRALSTK